MKEKIAWLTVAITLVSASSEAQSLTVELGKELDRVYRDMLEQRPPLLVGSKLDRWLDELEQLDDDFIGLNSAARPTRIPSQTGRLARYLVLRSIAIHQLGWEGVERPMLDAYRVSAGHRLPKGWSKTARYLWVGGVTTGAALKSREFQALVTQLEREGMDCRGVRAVERQRAMLGVRPSLAAARLLLDEAEKDPTNIAMARAAAEWMQGAMGLVRADPKRFPAPTSKDRARILSLEPFYLRERARRLNDVVRPSSIFNFVRNYRPPS